MEPLGIDLKPQNQTLPSLRRVARLRKALASARSRTFAMPPEVGAWGDGLWLHNQKFLFERQQTKFSKGKRMLEGKAKHKTHTENKTLFN